MRKRQEKKSGIWKDKRVIAMSRTYITIQLIGFAGTAFYFLSYQCKSNKNLFRVQFVSYLLYTIHLFLLGAVTGALSYILNLVRSLFLGSDSRKLQSNTACVILCVLQVLVAVFTWSGAISLLPVIANIATTIGGYTHSAKKIRLAGMLINSPLWIVYNVIVGSWAGILDEIVSEISMILSIVRFGWKNLDDEEPKRQPPGGAEGFG